MREIAVVNVQCFVLEEANLARRYVGASKSIWSDDATTPHCAAGDGKLHWSERVLIDTIPCHLETVTESDGYTWAHWNVSYDGLSTLDDSLPFPRQCKNCGYVFDQKDRYLATDTLYRMPDGSLIQWQEAPAGAVQIAPWLDRIYTPQLEHCINVKLPDGVWWTVDGQSSNCGIPDDTGQRQHHCWVIEGSLPNITVGKNGPSCSAGAGSIQTDKWHGFLRNGVLEQC